MLIDNINLINQSVLINFFIDIILKLRRNCTRGNQLRPKYPSTKSLLNERKTGSH